MAGYIQDKGRGLVMADTSSIKADVEAEFKSALGNTINLASSTPQGTLVTGETIARVGVMRNNADIANQINPDVSTGIFLDALMALMGISRGANAYTSVSGVTLNGVAGTTIPAGSRCRTPSGAIFVLVSDAVIPPSGQFTTATFRSQEYGPAVVNTNVVWTILDGIVGWNDPVTVPTSAVVTQGSTEMTDNQARIFRKQMLASQGSQSVRAAYARARRINGVKSISARENDTGIPTTIDGVSFAYGNAVWYCVDGGDDTEVAQALLESKSCGAAWDTGHNNGRVVSVTINDPDTGQAYIVQFTRPDASAPDYVEVETDVTILQTMTVSDPQIAAVDAILAWAAGKQQNEPGLVLGTSFSAFEVSSAIAVGVPGLYIKDVKVRVKGSSVWITEVPIKLWQVAVLPRGNINVHFPT